MKPGGARVAVGVGLGYLLGRTRKMRLALMIAAAGATGTLKSPRGLVQDGLKQLAASPELSKITDKARDELLNAAKSAAIGVATSRIDSINERLQERVAAPTRAASEVKPKDKEAEPPEPAPEKEEARSEATDEAAAEEAESEPDQENQSPDAEAEAEKPSPVPRPRSTEGSAGSQPRRASTRSRAGATRAPVRRTRR